MTVNTCQTKRTEKGQSLSALSFLHILQAPGNSAVLVGIVAGDKVAGGEFHQLGVAGLAALASVVAAGSEAAFVGQVDGRGDLAATISALQT